MRGFCGFESFNLRFLEPFKGFKIIHYVQYHKESGLRGQIVVCGLDESVDNGLIGYLDPKFEFYSPLNEENQQKFMIILIARDDQFQGWFVLPTLVGIFKCL